MNVFADNIKYLRKKYGLTQQQFGDKVGKSKTGDVQGISPKQEKNASFYEVFRGTFPTVRNADTHAHHKRAGTPAQQIIHHGHNEIIPPAILHGGIRQIFKTMREDHQQNTNDLG